MPLYSCSVCGLISSARKCEEHNVKRPNFRQRGYGSEFERNRKLRLKLTPNCVLCGDPANVADHIVRKRDGGSDALDNLRSLCRSCHSRHTATESPGGWNRKGVWWTSTNSA